ncbi:MAG: ACP S-malonyltransferase, partial [Gammaproteobacteria bacterium]
AKRALPLPVSVPSHCSLMQPAAAQLATRISQLALNRPLIPVLHNADVTTHDSAESIARALAEQLSQPVRWVETVQQFRAAGVTQVLECGPGKVLAGLVKRIDRELDIFAVHDPDSLQAALAALPHA